MIWLGMFKAYIDESGIHGGSPMFVLAGYLAPTREWDRFTRSWQTILQKYGIPAFHATDCNSNRKDFSKFENKKGERDSFVSELLATISTRRRIIPINVGVVIPDFNEPNLVSQSYTICMKAMMATIHIVMNRFPGRQKVALIFDRQDEFSGRAKQEFKRIVEEDWDGKDRFERIAFASARCEKALQAADALAFDSFREFRRRRENPERPPRRSYVALTTHRIMDPEWVLDAREAHAFINQHLGARGTLRDR
jgi:hypothetical protein